MERIFSGKDMERIGEFLARKPERGFLVYHGDADGACSAALFLREFKGFVHMPLKGPIMSEVFVKTILKKKPDLLVFLDLPVDQERKKLERFLEEVPDMRIIILDHHIAEGNINGERIIHANPRFIEAGIYIPASCMVYRMLEGMGRQVRPMIWIAAMGTIGDYGIEDCGDLMDECREEYPSFMEGNDLRKTLLGKGADIIAAAATLKGLHGVGESLKVLISAQGFEDFESSGKLHAWKRELDEEFETIIHSFGKEKQEYPEGLVVFEVKSALSITSMVATHLGTELPEKIVMIRKRSGDQWKVSLRNQSGRTNLGDTVKEAVKGIGSGGGHEKAAAGIVSDWDLFLKRFREILAKAGS
jgi:single-stranded DNA-specific DHH superfamily exonuclease